MKILAFNKKQDLEVFAARLVLKEVKLNPRLVLGLATGRTMVEVYKELVQRTQNSGVSFSEVKTFNLDEYVKLPLFHPGSFEFYMREKLFSHLNFNPGLCALPRGNALNLEAEALRYESEIEKSGGIDLQLLGLGANAHIGFNEPGSSFQSRTRVVHLSKSTIDQNQFAFPDQKVPEMAISMGISTIMKSKKIVLIVTGASKAEVLNLTLGDVNENVPASVLQRHPDVTILADDEALSLLSEAKRKTITHADNLLP